MHVLGPFDRFPLAAERAYNVAEAPLEAHEHMKRQVGLARTVLVQASGYGYDDRALLDALARLGARPGGRRPRARDPGRRWKGCIAPARGLTEPAHPGLAMRRSRAAGRRLRAHPAPLGWHLQLFAMRRLLALEPCRAAGPVVIDHMGLPDAAGGTGQPGFQAVLRLLTGKHVWVKLAGADRITRTSGRLHDAIPFIQALVANAPDRLVWGSDWPHIGFHSGQQGGDAVLPHRELDAGEMLDVLTEAVPDAATRRAILAGNPARLYGFDG
jgi:predicted TIM-barrel fold metal-dependent hydrolase